MKNNNKLEGINTLPLIDETLVQGYLDSLGKNIVEQMLALYKQQVAIYLTDIEKAQKLDSAELWQEHCHKMKGASASVGLMRVHGLLVILEKTSAQKQDKAILFTELKHENEQAVHALEQWLGEGNT